jgi:hypothetical protein
MNDLERLLRAEARELHRHKALGGGADDLRKRALVVNRLYGPGAVEKVRALMPVVAEGDAQ